MGNTLSSSCSPEGRPPQKTWEKDFTYLYSNPYADRLKQDFSDFVLSDSEGEAYHGHWRQQVFKRPQDTKLVLEIGSGHGHFLEHMANSNLESLIIGLDYRFKRSFFLAKKLQKNQEILDRMRFLRARAERLAFLFGKHEIDEIYLLFPDPWPKARHQKKRLFSQMFLDACARVLKPNGKVFVKTDHLGYFEHMQTVLGQNTSFQQCFVTKDLYSDKNEHFLQTFQTKFENIFLTQKLPIYGFELQILQTQ